MTETSFMASNRTGSGQSGSGFFTLPRRGKSLSTISLFEYKRPNRRSATRDAGLPTSTSDYGKTPPTGRTAELLQEKRSALLTNVKKQVKQLAEEAVTRKYIHEDSSNITSFCAAVDACLKFALLRSPLRNNRDPTTYAIIQDAARSNEYAAEVVKRIQVQNEKGSPNTTWSIFRSNTNDGYTSSSASSMSIPPVFTNGAYSLDRSRGRAIRNQRVDSNYQWIRVALLNKSLDKIVDYLVEHASEYYERVSILSHPCDGPLFADLLRGPCTHDYTRIRTNDHLWTDPSARELLQRQQIYASGMENRLNSSRQANLLVKQFSMPSPLICSPLQLSSDTDAPTPSPCFDLPLQFASDCVSPSSLLYNVSLPDGQPRSSFLGNDRSEFRWGNRYGPHQPLETHVNLSSPTAHHSIPSVSSPSSHKLTVAKDYVESLLQNEKSPLLYGKNNVMVQPSHCSKKILGYLSLHRLGGSGDHGLLLKWMPNQAMSSEPSDCNPRSSSSPTPSPNAFSFRPTANRKSKNTHTPSIAYANDSNSSRTFQSTICERNEILPEPSMSSETSTYWDFALNIELDSVVYIHCHHLHRRLDGGTVIFVREDGVQLPPLSFPSFSQVITFLQCLEHNLAPRASFDPPLDEMDFESDKANDSTKSTDSGTSVLSNGSTTESLSKHLPEKDSSSHSSGGYFCMRINHKNPSANGSKDRDSRLFGRSGLRSTLVRAGSYSFGLNKMNSVEDLSCPAPPSPAPKSTPETPVDALGAFENTCNAMRHQILTRVFYGWRAYTRSMLLIRKRLSSTVYPRFLLPKAPPVDARPVQADFWHQVRSNGSRTSLIRELYERIYFGGCEPSLRKEIWPFLLGHYPWSATDAQIVEIDRVTRAAYEKSVSEWLAVEAIIQQREKDANLERERIYSEAMPRMDDCRQSPQSPIPRQNGRRPPRNLTNSNHLGSQSDKPTIELITDAWNKVKRKLSTVHLPSARQSTESNGKSSSSSAAEDPEDDALRLSAEMTTPRIVFEEGDGSPQQRCMSMDLTDGTEDRTLTTTDDDTDAVSSSGHQHYWISKAQDKTQLDTLFAPQTTKPPRTQSCPNSPSQPGRRTRILLPHSQSANRALCNLSDSGRESDEAGGECESEAGRNEAKAADDVFDAQSGGRFASEHHEPVQAPKRRSRSSREETSGVCFSTDILEALATNIHRIDKDVARCDRNHPYFTQGLPQYNENIVEQAGGLCVANLDASANLYRLRTIMCTWTWQHLETGYVQGMCDLLAPLLVILDDEALAHACFCQLMQTMLANFPLPGPSSGGVVSPSQLERVTLERAPSKFYEYTRPRQRTRSSVVTIQSSPKSSSVQSPATGQLSTPASATGISPSLTSDPSASSSALGSSRIYNQFQHLQALLEVLDPVIASHMHLSEENAHLYFYRWFLLDFKRELKYDDVFRVWETIWTSRRLVTQDFGVFLAFALVQCYRDIILFYCLDYTDIIRFYNERAELHEASKLLTFARDMIYRLQTLIASS
ncbi:hypothetical protein AAHC03_01063 [Spirometra sp. Aus1]